MKLTNFKWDVPFFKQAAQYKCDKCPHTCEVYSNFEWVKGYLDDCDKCGSENVECFYIPVFLYRWDNYPTLSIDPAILNDEVMGCPKCDHVKERGGKFHWTDLNITCWECEGGRMTFEQYIEGEKMEEFTEIAYEESKLKAPSIGFSCNDDDDEDSYHYLEPGGYNKYRDIKNENREYIDWGFNFSAS
jgi:hypothetical protein